MATTLTMLGGVRLDLADDVDRVVEAAVRSCPHPVFFEGADGSRVAINWDHVLYATEQGVPGKETQ